MYMSSELFSIASFQALLHSDGILKPWVSAVGFPVTDAAARHRFYSASNWCYQVGVFVSRSSGLAYQVQRLIS